MIFLLSPSKGQDFNSQLPPHTSSQPENLDRSQQLVDCLREYDQAGLGQLMSISEKLAALNHARFQNFQLPFTEENGRSALFAFTGDVYSQIPAFDYSEKDLQFAQDHMRILSGLYGCLRPLDLIQPYRLEMKTRLKNPGGKNLYEFWGDTPTEALNHLVAKRNEKSIINLASGEYFKVIKAKKLDGQLITVQFKEEKNGVLKTIAIHAKRARGMMADFIISGHLNEPEQLKDFTGGGYRFSPEGSKTDTYLFSR
ncbi:MAG: peroxide stress protein YaaA [Thermodesulfobacteriota bacterium]